MRGFLWSLLAVIVAIVAVMFAMQRQSDQQELQILDTSAENFLDLFYSSLRTADYDRIYSEMVAEEWKRTTSLEDFVDEMQRHEQWLGGYKERKRVGVQLSNDGPDVEVMQAVYRTQYERDNVSETFMLKRRAGTWRIARYDVVATEEGLQALERAQAQQREKDEEEAAKARRYMPRVP